MKKIIALYCLVTFLSSLGLPYQERFDRALHLLDNDFLPEALEYFCKLEHEDPYNISVLYNIAHILRKLNKPENSQNYFNRVLAINPYHPQAHLGLAKTYLTLGDFKNGWPEFEWRMANFKKYQQEFKIHERIPQDFAHKKVAIRCEWGLGDMMMFVRYARELKKLDAYITVQTFKPLKKLFELCPYIDHVTTIDEPTVYQLQVPMMSLPYIFDTRLDNIPNEMPYLFADDTFVQHWQQKLVHNKNFKIGLCWEAKTKFLEELQNTRRSVDLSLFKNLCNLPNVSVYSLQKIDNEKFAIPDGIDLTIFPELDTEHGAFMDTAALMKSFDLIITVDTSVAHLAGALGVQTWVLQPYTAEWRWMKDRDDSPWYPTMKLFRQQEPGEWELVIQKVVDAVREQTNEPRKIMVRFFDRGNICFNNGDFDEAIYWYKLAEHYNNASLGLKHNLALALRGGGHRDEALEYYQFLLKHKPSDAHLHYGLGECYLYQGNFADGFDHFEWRWQRNNDDRRFLNKYWHGFEVKNKRILIRGEYGLGDTMQFMRYAQLLKEQGATVTIEAQGPLTDLLKLCPYIDEVVHIQTPVGDLPDFDYQIPVMSLPRIFQTQVTTMPQNIPYLFAKQEYIDFWREKLAYDKNFKIGLCWHASNYHESFQKNKKLKKSIPLNILAQLSELDGVTLYSLQRFDGLDQLENLPKQVNLHVFGDDFDKSHGRFMDTAAVIHNLDLIITVDTSVAHLAGAMGKPVWVVLPQVADWRWLANSYTTSPWYPTMKLFRQEVAGDWHTVVEHIQKELKNILE